MNRQCLRSCERQLLRPIQAVLSPSAPEPAPIFAIARSEGRSDQRSNPAGMCRDNEKIARVELVGLSVESDLYKPCVSFVNRNDPDDRSEIRELDPGAVITQSAK